MDLTPGLQRMIDGEMAKLPVMYRITGVAATRTELQAAPVQAADLAGMFMAAYRAGREDAARDIARVADSTRQSLVSTPPEYGREQYYHRTRAEAFERAVIIARGVDQPRTPSGCDGEDSPEERTNG